MKQAVAAAVAAILLVELLAPAACAAAQAADPFPIVPDQAPARRTHGWAYTSLLAGAGLIGTSFVLTSRANRTYDDYLASTDVAEMNRLYDETVRTDRLSAACLLTGEVLIATGVWLRFLHRPPTHRVSLAVDARRCAVSFRF